MAISFMPTGCFHSYWSQRFVRGCCCLFPPLPPRKLPVFVGATPSFNADSGCPNLTELVGVATTARLGLVVRDGDSCAETEREKNKLTAAIARSFRFLVVVILF